MLDLGWSELLVIAVVAIIVVGPKDLPRLMRSVGQWIRKAKRMASEFQQGIEDMVRDEELTSIRKDVEQMTRMDPTSGSSAPKPKAVAATPAADADEKAPAAKAAAEQPVGETAAVPAAAEQGEKPAPAAAEVERERG
ncbi:Sec-independent protein translocase protein TatB [Futiania mangrovi]|uniref:Sec-independent protein translocase protein TatB n=1 Tax=Futiania mangrovi TaxID=2959716 RepID=A0A9J6PBU0_9PROT|nr:Sec-independent protein translocase protein TatB [Futiania mangrovii]MCP1335977.1 Sec-independent protein translocase protein TatB [Futiania mangrovii]